MQRGQVERPIDAITLAFRRPWQFAFLVDCAIIVTGNLLARASLRGRIAPTLHGCRPDRGLSTSFSEGLGPIAVIVRPLAVHLVLLALTLPTPTLAGQLQLSNC